MRCLSFLLLFLLSGLVPAYCEEDVPRWAQQLQDTVVSNMASFQDSIVALNNSFQKSINEVKGSIVSLNESIVSLNKSIVAVEKNMFDVHHFNKNTFEAVRRAFYGFNNGTMFCLRIRQYSFFFSAFHVVNGTNIRHVSFGDIAIVHPHDVGFHGEKFTCMNIGKVPVVTVGDSFLSIGIDYRFITNRMRIWSGEFVTETYCTYQSPYSGNSALCRLVDSTQISGMSGGGVLNGCGIVGVATAVEWTEYADDVNKTIIQKSRSATVVYPITMALDFLLQQDCTFFNEFAIPDEYLGDDVDIPRKYYCNDGKNRVEYIEYPPLPKCSDVFVSYSG